MRKLATIRRIEAIIPIPNADKIETAVIDGWRVVVQKGQFSAGQLCVYCEIDSLLPEKPEFEFLRNRKFRIRTIKLKGQISQGICFPLSILPNKKSVSLGDDVTEILQIRKYEKDSEKPLKADKFINRYNWFRKLKRLFIAPEREKFPEFITKTDEGRIQNLPHIFTDYKNRVFQVTEKLDGQSATYFIVKNPRKWQFWKPYVFGVCSRNFLINHKNNTYWKIEKKYRIKETLKNIVEKDNIESLIIQGEIVGPSVQDNRYELDSLDFYVYNVFLNSTCLNPKFCRGILKGLKIVPQLIERQLTTLEDLIYITQISKSKLNNQTTMEGIVCRKYYMQPDGKPISFKVLNPNFLLEYDE